MSAKEVREEIEERLLSVLPPELAVGRQTDDSAFSMFDVDGDDE